MKAPKCHYPPCKGREMELANLTSEFVTFACRCGTIRALTLPSTRDRSNYIKTQQDIEEIRRLQRYRNSRPSFSFPTKLGAN